MKSDRDQDVGRVGFEPAGQPAQTDPNAPLAGVAEAAERVPGCGR
jgi:hypothetical protein